MTKNISLFTILLFSALSGICQSEQDIQMWIQLQLEKRQWTSFSETNGKFRSGWLRQVEFRTETDRFDIERQEYVFRVNPSTPAIRRAQSRLIEADAKESAILTQEINKEIKESIIRDLFEIANLTRKLELTKSLFASYTDQETLVKKMLQLAPSKIKDLIQIEQDIRLLKIEQFEIESKLKNLLGKNPGLTLDNLCNIETVKSRVQSFLFKTYKSRRLSAYEFEKEKLKAEKNLEIAENHRVLDFVQLRYNGPHSDLFEEKVALGIAFQLPFSSDNKMKMEELRIEEIVLDQQYQADLFLDSLEMENDVKTLLQMFEAWEFSKSNFLDAHKKYSGAVIKNNQSFLDSPELILYLNVQAIKNKLELHNQEFEIYEKYIDLLDQTNLFLLPDFWQPFVN